MKRNFALAACAFLAVTGTAIAAPDSILVDATRVFPESMTSTPNGTVIVSSIGGTGAGRIFRALPGADTAEPWIPVGSNHMLAPFGVLADVKSNTLWVCSNDAPGGSYHPAADQAASALLTFDLKNGKAKGYFPFPAGKGTSICNDVAIAPDGTAYITDSRNDRLLRLKRGADALEVWLDNPELKGGCDGVAVGDPKTLYFTLIGGSKIMRVMIGADGAPGEITEIKTDRPIKGPDGFRNIVGHNRYLLAEGGHASLITINGDSATVTTLKDGLTSTGVSASGNTGFVVEGKLAYRTNPQFKDQDPGNFRVWTLKLPKP